MKQKWFISCIGAVILALVVTAFTGCNSAAALDGSIRLHFDAAKLSAENTNTGKPIASGDLVAENTRVKFTAKLSGANVTVAKWHFGNSSFIPDWVGAHVYHRISAEEKNSSNVIAVSYEEREKTSCTILFNDSNIECKKWNDTQKDYTDAVASGTALAEGTEIKFSVKALSAVNRFADFLFSGTAIKNTYALSGKKQVHAKYAKNGTITISYIERNANQFKITFDDSKIECKRDNTPVLKDSYVWEGYPLLFTAKDNKKHIWHAGRWYWIDKKDVFEIVPNEEDFDLSGTISVYYTE